MEAGCPEEPSRPGRAGLSAPAELRQLRPGERGRRARGSPRSVTRRDQNLPVLLVSHPHAVPSQVAPGAGLVQETQTWREGRDGGGGVVPTLLLESSSGALTACT